MYTLGKKGEYGTYHPDTIYDEDGNAVCVVYGIPSNVKLEDLDERYAKRLETARKIVDALNAAQSVQDACQECGASLVDVETFCEECYGKRR